jgi:Tol biopolymer transport system component
MNQLYTANAVIDALGGTNTVSGLTGATAQAVSNWRRDGLPAKTFIVLSEALKANGYSAPFEVWGMIVAPQQDSEADKSSLSVERGRAL